ncbi:MAG: FAD-dependent oxidoreductase, partial [Oscillospiraceae bacterium]|nr:FAD-dependent oxidoreductase [Oscillospiraceae bacterium]
QILAQGAEVELETAAEVLDEGDRKIVRTEEGNTFEGRTVILATGVKHRMTGLPGEEELVGNGISFCAVCDGDFYKGKTVAVVGGGNSALQEAILLAGKCKEVIVVQDLDFFTGEQRLQEILFAKPNVRTMTGMRLEGYLRKDGELTGLQVRKTATGETSEIPCDGVFLAIGLIPENEPYRALAELDERGYFASGEDCRTKTRGIFCAGDCRRKNVRQVTTATADGAVAALAACRYLDGQE